VSRAPAYDLRETSLVSVRSLFETYHGYKSVSNSATYCFAVFEDNKPIAAYAWQPPPPGAAKSVCSEAPQGVLSLSLAWSQYPRTSDTSNTFPSHFVGR